MTLSPPQMCEPCIRPRRGMAVRCVWPRGAFAAFTLVEVVLALGICVFAVLPVVGLLPMALHSAQEATETTQEAKIIQRVANDLIQTPFADLSSQLQDGTYSKSFNYDGLEAATKDDAYYIAAATMDKFSFPGATPSTNIYRVSIRISTRGRHDPKTTVITIADTGY